MKTFIQYGAGNIGRGFIGALFSQAGYHVQFVDVNMEIINDLNARKSYPVEIVSKSGSQDIMIQNVSGIDGRDIAALSSAMAQADMMATAVGANILPRIVPNITAGLRRRWQEGNEAPLNIIICENLIDADKLLHKLILENLSETEKLFFEERVGLVEASIGRMVPLMTDEMKKGDNLRVCVEEYAILPVDRAAFKGEIPDIANILPFSPFEFFIRRKLFVHNMGHALAAYVGNLSGCKTLSQAISDPNVKLLTQRAMTESAQALFKIYHFPLESLLVHIDDLLLRFANAALGDTVARVGKDLKRKLSSSDRLAGAALFCENCGIEPVYICAGIAAGLLFENEGDEGTDFVHNLLEKSGIDVVLNDVCGLGGTIASKYVKSFYLLLKSGVTASALLAQCEDFYEEVLREKKIV